MLIQRDASVALLDLLCSIALNAEIEMYQVKNCDFKTCASRSVESL